MSEAGYDYDGFVRHAGTDASGELIPGTDFTIEAMEDSVVLEVSTPHLDDVVRISDLYGREGTSKP